MDLIILQTDLARQKETVPYIKEYIDFAKANGYNAVLLYLEAAVRVECTSFLSPDTSYTPEEIQEIVAYGNSQGIDIIPGLENLAHAENFLCHKGMEFLSECKDADVDGRGIMSGLGDCVCVSNPDAMAFFDTYYTQVVSLFTSQYVHAGMDEPFDFAVCPRCVERLQKGETKADLFYQHLMRTYNLLKSMGKTMMMWDDFFEYLDIVEKLPRDIIMCNWNYGFITDEPTGHWTNRKKKDWLRLYDELGFSYLFCTYGDYTAKTYNQDSFTNYAMKYHPKGAIMTVWRRSDRFNLAVYPLIAYTGRVWSGRATKEDKLKIYTELLGSEEIADMVLNLSCPAGSFQPNNLNICENYTRSRYDSVNLNGYVVRHLKAFCDTMEEGLSKDILLDIYTMALDGYLGLRTQQISLEIFDNYETRAKKPAYFVKQLQLLKELSNEAFEINKVLWEKYRPGILSQHDDFTRKFQGRAKRYDNMIAQLEENKKRGVFYAEMMLPSIYGTPRIRLEIHYKDKSIAPTVYNTTAKVADSINTIRFAMENKAIDYVDFVGHGEGAVYPLHFRYTYGGRKYVVSSVSKISGEAKNLKRILLNDSQFAELGNNDGQAHFEDLSLSKIENRIRLKFKKAK